MIGCGDAARLEDEGQTGQLALPVVGGTDGVMLNRILEEADIPARMDAYGLLRQGPTRIAIVRCWSLELPDAQRECQVETQEGLSAGAPLVGEKAARVDDILAREGIRLETASAAGVTTFQRKAQIECARRNIPGSPMRCDVSALSSRP